eukprot:TRINITY_DN42630_c0_g1_i1.p1 TRINITY_DN42630_c0_g1~~TRINITY_DN42630_c0_g1_i1.p1  ORF type:complete len:611 (+),score=65.40 TRINITY_DN42630_c0_g1_i1:131-1834(+)
MATTSSASRYNATHCACNVPPADAEVPMDVFFKVGPGPNDYSPQVNGRFQYYSFLKAAFSRRPYVSTDEYGEVTVSTHSSVVNARVSLSFPDGKPVFQDLKIASGAHTALQFNLSAFPPVVHNQVMVITLHRDNGVDLTRKLFFTRVAPPPKTLQSFVQVDYSRKALLVNGKPLLGVGYFDSGSNTEAQWATQAADGIDWSMRYLVYGDQNATRLPNSFIKDYLDWSHNSSLYVMLDLHIQMQDIAGGGTNEWALVEEQVRLFRDHPALLGWYVCDDCVTQYLNRQRNAGAPSISSLYDRFKELDPWHPLIGASESLNQVHAFTQASALAPSPSLDVVMLENYASLLPQNSHMGFADPGLDGTLRYWPMTYEPAINCPGPFAVARQQGYSDKDKAAVMYSMSWLSAVTADLPMQLHFRWFGWPAMPVYNEQMKAIGRYGKITREVEQFIYSRPSGMKEPWLSSDQTTPQCQPCARMWRRSDEKSFCAMIAIVNTVGSSANASFQLQGIEAWPEAASATFEEVQVGSGSPKGNSLSLTNGKFQVTLGAFDTFVYRSVHCDRAELTIWA